MTSNGHGEISIEKDIVYGKGGEVELKLDVYRPRAGTEKRTAVIQLYGGGFRGGTKDRMGQASNLFAERGYLTVAMNYRLSDVAKWPAQIQDLKACIRWLRANAGSLGIDPAKITIAGHSAGGYLAMVAAGSQNLREFEGTGGNAGAGTEIAAALVYYSPESFGRLPDGKDHGVMTPGSSDEDYRLAAPITYCRPGCAPTLFFHGTSDGLINHSASVHMYDKLREAGVPTELHLFEGVSHEFDEMHPEFGRACAEVSDLFLDRHVVNPRTYPPFSPGAIAARQNDAAPAGR